ncbi:uncharacterized protein EI97DRAFT_320102 [Westerdykella ornata]|uniref:Uncharacterized protein n=1 Tax=Westerdykella ornata TaxID=318751 RepID=A0A6A6JKF8_WESOR|nr:uncharacterized protein EI97DRAFT_320102 [Westerdykella ornata]KAF2276744.1 hypothetical protein EI97DRAFT_320102 [Westerdykella ornata]
MRSPGCWFGLLPLHIWLLTSPGLAEVKPYIITAAEYNTECKTCPRSLCPNVLAYSTDDSFNATCWTRGTRIIDGNLWLKSEAGCYVTQYDVLEYDGDYTTDLKYCGKASEEWHITEEDATIRYKAECRICPGISCDIVAYLRQDTDVTLTCWTTEGQVVIDDPYWLKTTNNCYVSRKHLYSKPDITYLDNCGPIPLLEIEKHNNENGTSDVNKREAAPVPEPVELAPSYLINVTVGEEYAYCRSCAKKTCKAERRYPFNAEVFLQCLVPPRPSDGANATYWSETTDFCYVENSDFWESPEGDCKSDALHNHSKTDRD